MRIRRALSFAVLGIGAAVATNAALRRRAGDLPDVLEGMQRTYRWRGMNVSYAEAGDADDPDLVLLHGLNAAASSGEWRAVFDRLAEEHHVVAPDLPGFGNSERPPLRYSAALYEDFVADFLAEFEEPTVVTSSLSGAYVARNVGDLDVSRLVMISPTASAGPEEPMSWLRELLRLPFVGELAFNLLTSKPAIRYFNADHGYARPDEVDEEWERYEWQTAHQENARFAPASFVSGYLDSDIDLESTLADLDVPVTLVWGREADISTLADGKELAENADRKLVVFDDAKLLPHVERGDDFATYLLSGDLPDDDSAIVEYDPDWSAEESAAAETSSSASTGAMVDETDTEAGAAEPSEAAVPESDDPEAVDAESDEEGEGATEEDASDEADDADEGDSDSGVDSDSDSDSDSDDGGQDGDETEEVEADGGETVEDGETADADESEPTDQDEGEDEE